MKNYIIQQLLEHNYSVYISITDSSIAISRDGVIGSAVLISTTKASSNATILDVRERKGRESITKYTYILAFRKEDKTIWLIPVDDVAENAVVRMDNREHYKLINSTILSSPSAKTLVDMDKEDIIKALKTSEDRVNDESVNKKIVDDVLNL